MKKNHNHCISQQSQFLPFVPCRFQYNKFGRKRYISPYEVKKNQVDIISGGGKSVGYTAAKEIV